MKNMAQLFKSRIKSMSEEESPDFNMTLRPYQIEAENIIMAEGEHRPFYLCWSRRLSR